MQSRLRRTFSILFFLAPLTAYADHEDALSTIFLGFGVILVFIVVILFLKIRIAGKLIISALFLTATLFTFNYVDTLPYYENMELINTLVIVIPSTIFLVSYLGLRKKFKKE